LNLVCKKVGGPSAPDVDLTSDPWFVTPSRNALNGCLPRELAEVDLGSLVVDLPELAGLARTVGDLFHLPEQQALDLIGSDRLHILRAICFPEAGDTTEPMKPIEEAVTVPRTAPVGTSTGGLLLRLGETTQEFALRPLQSLDVDSHTKAAFTRLGKKTVM